MIRAPWYTALLLVASVISDPPAIAQVGSIQGSFDVTTSGSSTYSLPIRTVPGSAGMVPQLTLSYDSQSLGGPVGAGWALAGVSTITRGSRSLYPHGRVTGVNLDENDVLLLDGQELVVISRAGTGASQRTEYRKRIDDQSRIVRIGDAFENATFEVDTKGGLKLIFDGSGNSRVRLGEDALLAAVSRIRDTAGNFIAFDYDQNGKGDFNLANVRYTGHEGATGVDREPFAKISFEYEAAPRPSEGYVAGRLVSHDRRLKSVISGLSLAHPVGLSQLVRYAFDYRDTDTLGRFVLTRIHEFGSDNSELVPTDFEYTTGDVNWRAAPAQLPIVSLAAAESLGLGYRAGNYTAGDTRPDLLFALEIDGKTESFAFENENGAWVKDEKFKPPIAFATADGADLGALVADINGDGRIDILQRTVRSDGHREDAALLAGSSGWENADGYKLPFDLSDNGKVTAVVALARLSGDSPPDLAYETAGGRGVLINTGTSWQRVAAPAPPAPLKDGRFIDLDCDGDDDFLAVVANAVGPEWQAWSFERGGWQSLAAAYLPPKSTAVNPSALRAARLNADACTDLIFAGQIKLAWLGGANGLVEIKPYAPTFTIIGNNGESLDAIVADLDGNGLSDVVVNHVDANGIATSFAYILKTDGWHSDARFLPPVLTDLRRKNRASPIVLDADGNATSDILLPSDLRDSFGKVLLGGPDGLRDAPNFAPKLAFSRRDQQDRGIRFVDLNADGLLDVLYRRDVMQDGKLVSVSDAQINTGAGWRSEPGLRPPLPFAGDGITGSPMLFVDMNGDGRLDLMYSYDKRDGTRQRKLYLNTVSADGAASWVEAAGSLLAPPQDYPFAVEQQGDQGVRLVDLNGDGREDILFGSVSARPAGGRQPSDVCKAEDKQQECDSTLGLFRSAAFISDGTRWVAAPSYAPPVPLVALGLPLSPESSDLGVQIDDVTGDRLPDIVAAFRHPLDKTKIIKEVWENSGAAWHRSDIVVPTMLDEPVQNPRVLVQWIDVNGDGFSDIVRSERRGSSNNSSTWLTTGRGFQAAPAFQIPLEAIADRDGDPAFRMADVNGDGLPDVLASRTGPGNAPVRKLWINTGSTFKPAPDGIVQMIPALIDSDGRDQGVRFFDVNSDGLLDVLQAYASGPTNEVVAAQVLLNAGNRSEMLAQYTGGYGLRTKIFYQPMGKPLDPSLKPSPWGRVYESGHDAVLYPLIRPTPATYLVSRVVVADASGAKLGYSYRYGPLLFDAQAMKSLGFAWREALNETSGILDRTEFDQSRALVGRPFRTTKCWLEPDLVTDGSSEANLCGPAGNPTRSHLLQSVGFTWMAGSGTVGPSPSEQAEVNQIALRRTEAREWELDGGLVSSEVTTLKYVGESSPDILTRFGNVEQTTTTFLDGASITTDNLYADDARGWMLGRLIQSVVVKTSKEGADTKTERRVIAFSYDPLTGLISTEVTDADSPDAVTKMYRRDGSGNLISSTSSARQVPNRATEADYDTLGRFSIAERLTGDNLKFETRLDRDPLTGAPLKKVEPDGTTTTMTYDGFGRLRESTSATGVVTRTDLVRIAEISDPEMARGVPAAYAIRTQIGDLPATLVLYDARDRALRSITPGFDPSGRPRSIRADVEYDSLGRVSRRSLAYETRPLQWLTTTYDPLGRPLLIRAADGAESLHSYASRPGGGRVIGLRDPLGHRAFVETDTRGLMRLTKDAKGGRVSYAYDAGGRLEVTTEPTGLKLQHKYDSLGRRILSNDPDLGIWRYRYDAYGQLVEQTDSKNQSSTFGYDAIGRIVLRSSPDSTVRWEYDQGAGGIGKLARVYESDKYEKSLQYDQFGRVTSETVTLRGEQYQTRIGLDEYGRIITTTLPTVAGQQGITVRNHYDTSGFLYRVTDNAGANLYWEALSADVNGRVLSERYGNGVTTTREYNPLNGRAESITVRGPSDAGPLLDLRLRYDLAGNLVDRQEAARGIKERFVYDELDRLVRMINTKGSAERYVFDAAGRLTFKSDVGTMSYPDLASGPWAPAHGVARTTLGGTVDEYRHDENGNRIEDSRRRFTYTADNRLKSVTLKAKPEVGVSFEYDPFGDRYLETDTGEGTRVETVAVGLFERVTEFATAANKPQRLRQTRYRYQVAGPEGVFLTIETILRPETPATPEHNLWYLHKDHLGSVVRITDRNGQLAARLWYDPWGKTAATFLAAGRALVGAWQRTFASHALYEGLGLIHMNGRVYDYAAAQFLTPDPFGEGVGDTQGLDRFAYVRGNPLRNADPTGYGILGDIGRGLGDLGSSIGHGLRHLGGEIGQWWNNNWREVVIVAAAVITVASFGTSCVATCAIMAGMAAGAVAGGTAAALYGGSFDDVVRGAITGAVIGGVTAGFSYGFGETWAAGSAENIAAHGMLGGVTEAARGGEFGRGVFVGSAAAVGDAYLPEFGETGSGTNIARSAVVGGTLSAIAGGNFSNGAILGAFAYAFNYALHKPKMGTFDALQQYLEGSGETVSYDISEFEEVDPRSFLGNSDRNLTQLSLAIAAGDGDYYIDTEMVGASGIPYATRSAPNTNVLGGVTLSLQGSLHVSEGHYYFAGSMRVRDDLYNMNRANRRWDREALTTAGRNAGRLFGSKPYKIEIRGSRAVGASGYIGP